QSFERLRLEHESLEREIAAKSESFRRVQSSLTVEDVKNLLPRGTAFVDFLEYRHGKESGPRKISAGCSRWRMCVN
ncbi:MAG: hypothetical protein AAGJ83_14965, partial [Planctomycetota bacterium]